MRCAVIAAVLLLVYIQDAAAGPQDISSMCKSKYPPKSCGGGWFRIDPKRCAKYFKKKKTFDDAEIYCLLLRGHLVSMHNADQNNNVMCLSQRTTKDIAQFWIGGTVIMYYNSANSFRWTDGSQYDFNRWATFQPDYVAEKCVEMNYEDWGRWNNYFCGKTRHFVCARNM